MVVGEGLRNYEEDVYMKCVHIKGLDTQGSFFRHFYKRDKFCDFLFALLHTISVLERSLL